MRPGIEPEASRILVGLRIQHCRELWYRLQIQLGSGIATAVAEASDYSSDWTPSLGREPPYDSGAALKKTKKKKNTHEGRGGSLCSTVSQS